MTTKDQTQPAAAPESPPAQSAPPAESLYQIRTKGLAHGLAVAQRVAHSVEKDSKNQHFSYKYASGEAVIGAAKQALAAGDLSFFADKYEVKGLNGENVSMEEVHAGVAVLHSTYTLLHATGEARTYTSPMMIFPERGRPPDKALAAAKTYDLAYMLRALLLLPRVDENEPDPDNRQNDQNYEPRTRDQQQRREPQQRRQQQRERSNASNGNEQPPAQGKANEKPAANSNEQPPAAATAAPEQHAAAEDEARELQAARHRLSALSQYHGAAKCKAATENMPRASLADHRAMIEKIEKDLGPLPEGFKAVSFASVPALYAALQAQGLDGSEPAVAEVMMMLFGNPKLSDLSAEKRTVLVRMLQNTEMSLFDMADAIKADIEMDSTRKAKELSNDEWRQWLLTSEAER